MLRRLPHALLAAAALAAGSPAAPAADAAGAPHRAAAHARHAGAHGKGRVSDRGRRAGAGPARPGLAGPAPARPGHAGPAPARPGHAAAADPPWPGGPVGPGARLPWRMTPARPDLCPATPAAGVSLVTTPSSGGPNASSEMSSLWLMPDVARAGWAGGRPVRGQDSWYRVR